MLVEDFNTALKVRFSLVDINRSHVSPIDPVLQADHAVAHAGGGLQYGIKGEVFIG